MQRITVVSVPVSDQEVARRFYVEKLGFELMADAPFGDGLRWLQVRPPGSEASLSLVTWFEDMPAGSLRGLVLDTDDLEADHRALVERGVPFAGPPTATDGGTFATFADPDGNHLSLRQAD
jgi:catechol 2,3-dioxygenase-like lactoylglutathione lyase family enzyme